MPYVLSRAILFLFWFLCILFSCFMCINRVSIPLRKCLWARRFRIPCYLPPLRSVHICGKSNLNLLIKAKHTAMNLVVSDCRPGDSTHTTLQECMRQDMDQAVGRMFEIQASTPEWPHLSQLCWIARRGQKTRKNTTALRGCLSRCLLEKIKVTPTTNLNWPESNQSGFRLNHQATVFFNI